MSAAETPASASAPCATSTISDSTSRPSCLPNLLCAQPTMHPVIATLLPCCAAEHSKPPRSSLSYMVWWSPDLGARADGANEDGSRENSLRPGFRRLDRAAGAGAALGRGRRHKSAAGLGEPSRGDRELGQI